MSDEGFQKELLAKLTEMIDGQRALYVNQRDLELKVKQIEAQLTFVKFTLNEDVVKKLNVLIDDVRRLTRENAALAPDVEEDFSQAKNEITARARAALEKTLREPAGREET